MNKSETSKFKGVVAMTEKHPCKYCDGLGFRSLDNEKLHPAFNVFGMHRRVHASGKVTWEGDCIMCKGTGLIEPEYRQEMIKKQGLMSFLWKR